MMWPRRKEWLVPLVSGFFGAFGLILAAIAAGLQIGAPLGFTAQYAATRIIPKLPPGGWMPVGIGVAVMIAAGVLAAYLPARRASSADPLTAPRYE